MQLFQPVRASRWIPALVFLCAALHAVDAHPHMFLDASLTVRADETGVSGVYVEWRFDQWFSSSILVDYDLDRNRKFDATETADVHDHAFQNLRNFGFFTFFGTGARAVGTEEVSEFAVRVEENRVIYRFFAPFDLPFNSDSLEFSVASYDPTFFCDVAYEEESPVGIDAPSGVSIDYSIRTDRDVEITYSNAVVGNGRGEQSYSGVAHPKRVHIVLSK